MQKKIKIEKSMKHNFIFKTKKIIIKKLQLKIQLKTNFYNNYNNNGNDNILILLKIVQFMITENFNNYQLI
jgi:hypothetical protein